MRVVALAGGVGGAKLVDGLAQVLPPEDLTTIVNTGDDFDHLGLRICPDLDTVCYTLAGIANPETGWGRADETWNAMDSLAVLGGPKWFRLGDRDLGIHLERTRLLNSGFSLSRITERFCEAWHILHAILPMSDDPIPTRVCTDEGELSFQEYFVHRQCQPRVKGFRFEKVYESKPAPGVLSTLQNAHIVVLCPSNPWVSIDPILAVPGVREELLSEPGHPRVILAVSPIIQGTTLKGPAAKMFSELGFEPTALAVAGHYGAHRSGGLLDGFILDELDKRLVSQVEEMGINTLAAKTLMTSTSDRQRLAEMLLAFGRELLPNLKD
jgi:LPPG:FO 2-phospho-L-lactate transferase